MSIAGGDRDSMTYEEYMREVSGQTRPDLEGFGCFGAKNNAVLYEKLYLRNS